MGAYSVWIGVPFADGMGCNNVLAALGAQEGVSPSAWKCEGDASGNTQLWFNAVLYRGAQINAALNEMYPDVNGFNCPDY